MRSGNHGPGSPSSRRRGAFRPTSERLEDRKLMAVIDLSNVAQDQTSNANLSIGVQEIGAVAGDGAGYTVTDVGNVTGSGYDSFLVSAPTITTPTSTGTPTGTGQSRVFLIFGSKQVNSTTVVNFFTLSANQRAGDLLSIGTVNQVNPLIVPPITTTDPLGFDFDGLAFSTTTNNSLLGASVAGLGDVDGDGIDDFAIGAPNQGTGGTAYVIFGGTALTSAGGRNINLDTGSAPTRVSSFFSPNAGDQLGSSVAGIGKFLTQGATSTVHDVAFGAPGANSGAGAVYAITGAAIANAGTNVNITTIGTSDLVFTGQAGDRAGASLSTAGNYGDYDGTTTANIEAINGLLIGAPGAIPAAGGTFASGRAYLIYGDQTINPVNNASPAYTGAGGGTFDLGSVGITPTTAIPNPVKGLILNGISTGRLGFTVSSAGDFNSDGFDDVMIGAPGGVGSTGFVSIIYGTASASRSNGSFQIDPLAASTLITQYLTGLSAGDLTGYSVAPILRYNGGTSGFRKAIAIGAPATSGNQGVVYVVTALASAAGTVAPIVPSQILTATNSNPGSPAAFGTSIGTRPLFSANQLYSVDQDPLDDLIIGAPGYNPIIRSTSGTTSTRTLAGTGFAVSGLKLLNSVSPATFIGTAMGVNGLIANFSIDSTSTNTTIFIYSTPAVGSLPAFAPATAIDPSSIFINGTSVGTVSNLTSVADTNGDGIAEASFTVPTSVFGTLTGLVNLPILLAGATTGGVPFVASTTALINGSGGGGGGGGGTGTAVGTAPLASALFSPRTFSGTTNGELVPAVETLEHLNSYQPLPVAIAYNQYLAAPGFRAREQLFAKGGKNNTKLHQTPAGTTVHDKYYNVQTLPHKVFVRGKFKHGQSITFTHKVKVIPRNRQKDTYTSF